ncbi:Amidinotransferase [Balamuthia mandrillaris]
MEDRTFPQTTSTVVMVPPLDFVDAVLQKEDHDKELAFRMAQKAQQEWDESVRILRQEGVNVLTLEYPPNNSLFLSISPKDQPSSSETPNSGLQTPNNESKPQAVFCNNWMTTHGDGTLIVYPMKQPERRRETHLLPFVQQLLVGHGFNIRNMLRIGQLDDPTHFLEGTGSMVFDHSHKVIYVCKSPRTSFRQLNNFMEVTRHFKRAVLFRGRNEQGQDIYHTDILLSIGERFAVFAAECVPEELDEGESKLFATREEVLKELETEGKRKVILLSSEQVNKYFCGNILQLRVDVEGEKKKKKKNRNKKKKKRQKRIVVMSRTAYNHFSTEQLKQLEEFGGKLVVLPLETIEKYGEGSARCILLECFLPNKEDPYLNIQRWLPDEAFTDEAERKGEKEPEGP